MNPIVHRELRLASRRPETYRLRAWAVSVGLVIIVFLLLLSRTVGVSSEQTGRNLLSLLGHAAFVFVLVVGAFSTSDRLSSEHRMGTFGLLFLTRLKVVQVVFGKLASHSLTSLYGFVAVIPLLGLPSLFGGVTFDHFARLVTALLSCLVLSSCVGLFSSSIRRNASDAMTLTLLIMLLPTFALPALEGVFDRLGGSGAYFGDLLGAVGLYQFVFNTLSGRDSEFFGVSALLYLVGAWFFFVAACIFSKWAIRDGLDANASVGVTEKSRADADETGRRKNVSWLRRLNRQCPRLLDDTVFGPEVLKWRVSRSVPYLQLPWLFLGLYLIVYIGFLFRAVGNDAIDISMALLPLHILFKMLVVVEAYRRFNGELQEGSLELLSVTPQSVCRLPDFYFERIGLVFRNQRRLLAAVNLITLILFWWRGDVGGSAHFAIVTVFMGGIYLLFLDVSTLTWLG